MAVLVIGGMPGVGKTALAVHVAHVLQGRFPDRQLFIDLHAHTPGRTRCLRKPRSRGCCRPSGSMPARCLMTWRTGPVCGGTG